MRGEVIAGILCLVLPGRTAEPKIPDFTRGEKLFQQGKEPLRARMLASGREDLMPDLKAYAHGLCVVAKTGKPFKFEVSEDGRRVWHTGYNLVFLSEYHMVALEQNNASSRNIGVRVPVY